MSNQSNQPPDRFPTDDHLAALAVRAAAGDQVALSDLVRATQADVWRFCTALVDRASADDLAQEVYARAIVALPRYRGESPVRPWLLGIARHVCIDTVRRRERRRRIRQRLPPPPASTPDPSAAVDLEHLLAALDTDQRAAFTLTQVLGLRYAEAADALGVPIGTVRSRVARAREALVAAAGGAGEEAGPGTA